MGSDKVLKFKSWNEVRIRFFGQYREVILGRYGYDVVRPDIGRITMANPEFILVLFAELKQREMLGSESYERLAGHLYEAFSFSQGPEAICSRLKKLSRDSLYASEIQEFMSKIRKIDKYK